MKPTYIFILSYLTLASSYRVGNKLKVGLGAPYSSEFTEQLLPKEQIFLQKLDHFNPTVESTWSQRYWRNPSYYEIGGPAFLMINGEAPAEAEWATIGQWMSYAKENRAICFLLEHRFYGNSQPTNDTSSENLEYLSSEQALADLAYFIIGMNKAYNLPNDIKWIVFGGSYAGSLAAWTRMKYPHLVHGAVSSSGPLLAKIDFHEYFEVVRNSLSTYSEDCVTEVKKANEELNKLVVTEAGRSIIKETFKLCDDLEDDEDDIASLFENLAGNFADVVQYNKDNRNSSTKFITIDSLCDVMTGVYVPKKKSFSWQRYAAVNRVVLKANKQECLSFKYKEYVDNLKKVDWKSASENGRQWLYQTCTEFGFYQTSSHPSDIFGNRFPIRFFTKQCKEIFGSKFDEKLLNNGVSRTNILYGALDINVGNIIYVHGSVDPWHALGICEADINKPYEAILINGTAHCADMYPFSSNDPAQLKLARKRVSAAIASWITNDKLHSKSKLRHLIVKFSRNNNNSSKTRGIFIDEY